MTTVSLARRIEGTPQGRILREFATNAAIFPVFDAIRTMATQGVAAYVLALPHYMMLISAAVQAWFLGTRKENTWWQAAAGNLIGVSLYTVLDILLEGPADFAGAPYHWVYWVFSLGMALLYAVKELGPRLATLVVVASSLWRVLLFPALYVLSETTGELGGSLNWDTLRTYWASSGGHTFILLASVMFGLLLGLSEAQVNRYMRFLQEVAQQLRQYSEWSIDPNLLAQSLQDVSALGQRRVERTILFMDIRGFTNWSQHKDPETVVGMLNQFYEISEQVLRECGGHKPHFIGDEVMTWFDDPATALKGARDLVTQANAALSVYGLAVGVGLHSGEVVEGLMGSTHTRLYNIIGDTVNTTSRLVSAAQPGEVLASETVVQQVAGVSASGEPRFITAKGKDKPLKVYPV